MHSSVNASKRVRSWIAIVSTVVVGTLGLSACSSTESQTGPTSSPENTTGEDETQSNHGMFLSKDQQVAW